MNAKDAQPHRHVRFALLGLNRVTAGFAPAGAHADSRPKTGTPKTEGLRLPPRPQPLWGSQEPVARPSALGKLRIG